MLRLAVGTLVAFALLGGESKAGTDITAPGAGAPLKGGTTVNVSAYTNQGTPAKATIKVRNRITGGSSTTNAVPVSDGMGGWTVTKIGCRPTSIE